MDKNKNKWISDKIRKLLNEGKYSQDQSTAIAYSLFNSKQQGGYSDPTKAFIEKSVAQLPILRINYNVETTGVKEGNLQPGYYTRVDYNNGKSDYLRPEGLSELQRMNNYRLYMEKQANQTQSPMQTGQPIAMPSYQGGGYNNPAFAPYPNTMNNSQPFAKPEISQEMDADLSGLPAQTPNYERILSTDMAMVGDTSTMDTQTRGDRRLVKQYKYDQNQGYWSGDKYNNINKLQVAQLFGGVPLESALYYGAQGFGQGKIGQGVLGSLTAGLKAARIGMSGYAAGKENQRGMDYMRNQLYAPNTDYEYGQVGQNQTYGYYGQQGGLTPYFREGGKVPTNAEMLTGDYITDQPNANLKVEDREYVRNSQTEQIQKAVGDKHEAESGGIPVNLPPQSQILSDFTPLKASNAKELSNRYKISLKPKDTPAKAMDKYNKKIGYDKLVEKETELTEKFEEQTKSSVDKTTKNINLTFISKELERVNNEKEQLKPIQDIAFQDIFRVQESIPKKGRPGELIGKDGKVVKGTEQMAQQGGYSPSIIALSKKYQLTPQRITEIMQQGGEVENEEQMEGENEQAEGENAQLEQIEQAAEQAIQKGADPNKVLQQLIQQGIPQELAVQMVQEIVQEGESQQSGGGPEQLIQAFAQATQQDPNQIAQQLQQLPPEQQQQAMQQMAQSLQQNPQEESAEGPMSNQQEESVETQMREGGYSLPMYQGGSWVYNVTTGKNEYRTNTRAGQHAAKDKAYGIVEPEKALQYLYNNFPDIISEKFKNNITVDKQGNVSFKKNLPLNKEQEIVGAAQQAIDSRMKNTADVILSNPDKFSPEQIKEATRYKEEETFLQGDPLKTSDANSIRGYDKKIGDFTSGRYSLGLDLVTPEDLQKLMGSGIKTLKQLKNSPLLDKLSPESKKRIDNISGLIGSKDADFFINEFKVPEQKKDTNYTTTTQNPQVQNRMVTKTIAPNLFQPYIMPPSSLQVPYKPEVTLSRIDPTQQDIAAYEANINSQAQTAMSNNYHLSDVQRAANNANITAAAQIATNDVRAKVTGANTAAREKADFYNAQQADKEKLTNVGLNQQYETKANQAILNNEIDWRKHNAQVNAQTGNYFREINDINTVNAGLENYQTDGSNIYFNQQPLNIKNYTPDVNLQKMFEATKDNPEEREKLRQAVIESYKQLMS